MKNYLDHHTLDHLMEGFQLIDYDWRYQYINEAAAKHGLSSKELLFDRTMMEVYPGIENTDMFKTLQECMEKRIEQRIENEFVYPDGTSSWFELQIEPVKEGLFILSIDISARKKAENELLKINENLERIIAERTQQLAESLEREKKLNTMKSNFVSIASHEFRTPLTTMLSSLSLVAKYEEQNDHENHAKHVQKIKNSIRNLTDILSDFLSVSKLEEGKVEYTPEKVNLHHFLGDIISEMEGIKKNGQKIVLAYSGEENAYFDPKLLRNVLLNLISNAIKFSPDSTNIEVKANVSAGTAEVSVKDEGIGISQKDQEQLFERFFRGENAMHIQGTGLGLNIVSNYVELMNGTLSVESEENKGTCFLVSIPQ